MADASPWWVEPGLVVGGFAGTTLAALVAAFRKRGRADPEAPTSAIAASVISDKAVEKIGLVIREAAESIHDDTRRQRETMSDLIDCMRDLSRAIKDGLPPVAGIDFAGFMARLSKIEREP